jgi:hypothetical protein
MDERTTYWIVTYSWNPVDIDRLRAIYPDHRIHVDGLGARGGLWLTGMVDDHHALAIFRTAEAAQTFLTSDPYASSGIVKFDELRQWTPIEYPGK